MWQLDFEKIAINSQMSDHLGVLSTGATVNYVIDKHLPSHLNSNWTSGKSEQTEEKDIGNGAKDKNTDG